MHYQPAFIVLFLSSLFMLTKSTADGYAFNKPGKSLFANKLTSWRKLFTPQRQKYTHLRKHHEKGEIIFAMQPCSDYKSNYLDEFDVSRLGTNYLESEPLPAEFLAQNHLLECNDVYTDVNPNQECRNFLVMQKFEAAILYTGYEKQYSTYFDATNQFHFHIPNYKEHANIYLDTDIYQRRWYLTRKPLLVKDVRGSNILWNFPKVPMLWSHTYEKFRTPDIEVKATANGARCFKIVPKRWMLYQPGKPLEKAKNLFPMWSLDNNGEPKYEVTREPYESPIEPLNVFGQNVLGPK